MKEILFDATFPEQELNTYKQNSKQQLTVNNEKVGYVARKKFNEMIFGASHPYGYAEKMEDYDNMKRDDLLSVFSSLYTKENCTLIVAGKITDAVFKTLNANFGANDWRKAVASDSTFNPKHQTSNIKLFIEKKDAVQSAIRIGKPLFNKTHPDYAGMQVLNTVLGGYFGSRLMSNIREDKGYTYGVGSAVASLLHDGFFFISTETGVDVTQPAIHEIYKEIDRLKKELIPDEELAMVKNYMTGSFLRSIDGAFQLADRCKGIIIYDLDYDYFYNYLNIIKTITSNQLLQLAEKYLENESFYELVVGGK
jgi:predicted Zn-dependent peptidase